MTKNIRKRVHNLNFSIEFNINMKHMCQLRILVQYVRNLIESNIRIVNSMFYLIEKTTDFQEIHSVDNLHLFIPYYYFKLSFNPCD